MASPPGESTFMSIFTASKAKPQWLAGRPGHLTLTTGAKLRLNGDKCLKSGDKSVPGL